MLEYRIYCRRRNGSLVSTNNTLTRKTIGQFPSHFSSVPLRWATLFSYILQTLFVYHRPFPDQSEILTIKIALPLCALSFQVPTYIFRFLLFVCFSAAGVLETYNFHRSLRQSRARTISIYGKDEGCIGVEVRKQIKFVSRGNRKLFAFVGKVYVVLRDFAVTLTNHRLLFHFSSPLLIRLLPLTQMCSVDWGYTEIVAQKSDMTQNGSWNKLRNQPRIGRYDPSSRLFSRSSIFFLHPNSPNFLSNIWFFCSIKFYQVYKIKLTIFLHSRYHAKC